MMKHLKLLMSLLMLLFFSSAFASCSKDDDPDNTEQSGNSGDSNENGLDLDLVGTWQYSSKDSSGGTYRIERTYNRDGSWYLYNYYTEKNGEISDQDSAEGKWYTEGNRLICNYKYGFTTVECTYRISGNVLYLDFGGGSKQELRKIK